MLDGSILCCERSENPGGRVALSLQRTAAARLIRERAEGDHASIMVTWTNEGRHVTERMRMQQTHIGHCVTKASRSAEIESKW